MLLIRSLFGQIMTNVLYTYLFVYATYLSICSLTFLLSNCYAAESSENLRLLLYRIMSVCQSVATIGLCLVSVK